MRRSASRAGMRKCGWAATEAKWWRLRAGDVAVLPAGTGHQRLSASGDLLVIGAYPPQGTYDLCRADNPADRLEALADHPAGAAAGERSGSRPRRTAHAVVAAARRKPCINRKCGRTRTSRRRLPRVKAARFKPVVGPVAEWRRRSRAWTSKPGSNPGRASNRRGQGFGGRELRVAGARRSAKREDGLRIHRLDHPIQLSAHRRHGLDHALFRHSCGLPR